MLLELIETAGKVLVESGFTISQRITRHARRPFISIERPRSGEFLPVLPRALDARSATSKLLGKEANSTSFRQRPPTAIQIEGFSWPNHKPPPKTARRWTLRMNTWSLKRSLLWVAAASNRTQEDWACDSTDYSRSTSKLHSTRKRFRMQARLSGI